MLLCVCDSSLISCKGGGAAYITDFTGLLPCKVSVIDKAAFYPTCIFAQTPHFCTITLANGFA